MAYVVDLSKLKTTKTKTYTYQISSDGQPENPVIPAKSGTGILYFEDVTDISKFEYAHDGKDLKITYATIDPDGDGEGEPQDLVLTVKNYFTTKDATATNSTIKYIKYKNPVEEQDPITVSIIDNNLIDATWIESYKVKKGVLSGTAFGDEIVASLDKATDKKSKGLTINAGKGNDIVTGTKFNDTITGGKGKNTVNFDFSDGFGKDKVKLTKDETLVLKFTQDSTAEGAEEGAKEDVAAAALTYTKSGNNLIITHEGYEGQQVTVQNFFKTAADVSIGANDLKEYLANSVGVLNLSGKGKFSATDYSDNITGSKKADTISTGKGTDIVDAKGGNDTIKLGEGDKVVNIGYADGNDTIKLSNTASLNLIIDDGDGSVDVDSLTYARSVDGKDLYIYRENDQYTIIKNYYVKGEGEAVVPATELFINGDDEFDDTNISSAKNLDKKNTLTIGGEDGAAEGGYIMGNKNDTVTVNAGDNEINLLKGNDTVTFATGYNDETIIKTAGGNDTIKFLGADLTAENEQIAMRKIDDNIIIVAGEHIDEEDDDTHAYAEIANFKDISSTVTVKDKNNAVVATLKSGSGKLKGTKGDDIIVGGTKNDTITAGEGINNIYIRGGNDTVVLSKKGFDFIDATENATNSTVNVKTNTLYYDLLSKNGDSLEYFEGVDKNNFAYVDFFKSEDGNKTTADLYATVGKTKYHIVNETDNVVDYSAQKDNNIVFLTGEEGNGQHYAASEKINVVHAYNDAGISYNGGHDVYYANGEYDNLYEVSLTGKTNLEINDLGGEKDTLSLSNYADELRLFFNVGLPAETEEGQEAPEEPEYYDNGYLLYNNDSFDYKHVMNVTKGDTTGSVSVIESSKYSTLSDRSGTIENVYAEDYAIDMEGWKSYVTDKVQAWLEGNKQTSVLDVLSLNQKKAANKALVNDLIKVYKDASYANYMADSVADEDFRSLSDKNFADLVFVKSDNNLVVKENGEGDTPTELFTKEGFFAEPTEVTFFAKGENTKYVVASDVTSEEGTHMSFENGEHLVLLTDKAYSDFYTKSDGVLQHYTAGDPLIYKGSFAADKEHHWPTAGPNAWKDGGDNLTIGNIQVDNTDGKSGDILIQDKDGLTKTIIVDKGDINGTFESEIIVGSNSADVINAMGGDDLIYSGGGDDVLNFVASDRNPEIAPEPTGNNTAPMTVIGGSGSLPADHTVDAISVYDTAGSDTYNTTLGVGLYVEDIQGEAGETDTINITADGVETGDIRYMFDVYNPKYLLNPTGKPTFYADLFIMSKDEYTNMATSLGAKIQKGEAIGGSTAEVLESLQGSFGYVWVDDQYVDPLNPTAGAPQKIEEINLNGSALSVDIDYTKAALPTGQTAMLQFMSQSSIQTTYQAISAWLSKKGYDSAWSVVENDKTAASGYTDTQQLFQIYGMSKAELVQNAAALLS